MSKTRFFAAQFLALFKNDLWIKNAKIANNMAQELKKIFDKYSLSIKYSVDSNQIFVVLPEALASYLKDKGSGFYLWNSKDNLYRFVTSCFNTLVDLEIFDQVLKNYFSK